MRQRMEADGCGIDKWKRESGVLKEGGEEDVNIVSPEPDPGDSHCGHMREAFHRGEQGWRCEQSSVH